MGYTERTIVPFCIGFGASNPGDATAYYFANTPIRALEGATIGGLTGLIEVPKAARIVGCRFGIFSATATGTAEDWTFSIRVNNTTNYAIATVGAATALRIFENYNLSIPLAAGDGFEITTTTPAWVTNPEGCRGLGFVYVEM